MLDFILRPWPQNLRFKRWYSSRSLSCSSADILFDVLTCCLSEFSRAAVLVEGSTNAPEQLLAVESSEVVAQPASVPVTANKPAPTVYFHVLFIVDALSSWRCSPFTALARLK